MSQLDNAQIAIKYELSVFANTIKKEYREDFFHPMNRDHWVASFCAWLRL